MAGFTQDFLLYIGYFVKKREAMKKISITRRKRFARELRKQITCLSDQEILSIGSGRNAFSLFYEVGDIHLDPYFSRD